MWVTVFSQLCLQRCYDVFITVFKCLLGSGSVSQPGDYSESCICQLPASAPQCGRPTSPISLPSMPSSVSLIKCWAELWCGVKSTLVSSIAVSLRMLFQFRNWLKASSQGTRTRRWKESEPEKEVEMLTWVWTVWITHWVKSMSMTPGQQIPP